MLLLNFTLSQFASALTPFRAVVADPPLPPSMPTDCNSSKLLLLRTALSPLCSAAALSLMMMAAAFSASARCRRRPRRTRKTTSSMISDTAMKMNTMMMPGELSDVDDEPSSLPLPAPLLLLPPQSAQLLPVLELELHQLKDEDESPPPPLMPVEEEDEE